MNNKNIDPLLKDFYNEVSKHSNYQVLSPLIQNIFPDLSFTQNINRYEVERFKSISDRVDFKDTSVLDIGGNTGYFSFEAYVKGANSALVYEGNKEHCEFVDLSARHLMISDKIKSKNAYFDMNDSIDGIDTTFLLNVLHHCGDDYGDVFDKVGCLSNSKNFLDNLSQFTRTLIFQMGFNWKGDRNLPLFESGTKKELIDWVKDISADNWIIESILIAEKSLENFIEYKPLNNQNIERIDSYGEFLNRPIFILKNKK